MELCCPHIDDAPTVAEIHVSAWRAAYDGIVPSEYLAGLSIPKREAYWSGAIQRGDPELIVAKDFGQVVGWAAFGPCRDVQAPSNRGELYAIYVAPAHWSKGVGRALWQHTRRSLAERFTHASLWVLVKNTRAIKFYLAMGFLPEPSSIKTVTYAGRPLEEMRYIAAINS